jgi:hypothetical protein
MRGAAELLRPRLQQAERVVPQGVELHRLAAARRDHPVADLGVHPRQLVPLFTLREQAVGRIDADAEARPAQVMLDDVDEDRQEQPQRLVIAGREPVALHCVEEP